MENTLDRIAKCRYKTKMDKRSGFWQVDLTAAAQELLAFITPKGRVFKWKVMPFGVANAPPHVETQIFHLLFHKLTFFEFDSEMGFLTNNEKFTEEKDMVLLGISTQTHVVDVSLHFCTPRNQLLY